MKKELLDKEVLCAYDIRQIQKFIFRIDKDIDVFGANVIMLNILSRAIEYSLENSKSPLKKEQYSIVLPYAEDKIPYFNDDKIMAQIISIGGGNAFMLFRKGSIAKDFNHTFSRYLIDNTYSLEVAIASVLKSDIYTNDSRALYDELDRVKASAPSSQALGTLPIVETEPNTGYPVIGLDEMTKEMVSLETIAKREGVYHDTETYDDFKRIKSIITHNQTLAYIHMDGNSMGVTIGKILNDINDYEEGIKVRSMIDHNIGSQYRGTLTEVEKWFENKLIEDGIKEDDVKNHYSRIHVGGDDINMMFDAKYVFCFVEHFMNEISKKYLWNDDRVGQVPFSVCCGIGFVSSKVSTKVGLGLAEECCEIAKKEAKKPENLIDGKVGNWIDFHIQKGLHIQDLDSLIEKGYTVDNNRSLLLRPYCLDKELEDLPCHFNNFKKYHKAFFDKGMSLNDCKMIEDAYSLGKKEVSNVLRTLSLKNRQVPDFMKTPFIKVPSRDNECAIAYDVLEIGDLYKDLGE